MLVSYINSYTAKELHAGSRSTVYNLNCQAMEPKNFLNITAIERDKVLEYISIHTIYPYENVKYVADCFVGSRIGFVHPLDFLWFTQILSLVPDNYNE